MVRLAHPPGGIMKGHFGIGIYQPKFEENLGVLWRSAWQLGADYIFVIGSKYKITPSDTPKVWRQIPCYEYETWQEFNAPKDVEVIAIEMGGKTLESFNHPKLACYLLGNESHGINDIVLKECDHHVSIPSIRLNSYNVSVAGSLVLYDRMVKLNKQKAPL